MEKLMPVSEIFNNGQLNIIKGSGALSGKMLLVSIVENNKFNAYFRAG